MHVKSEFLSKNAVPRRPNIHIQHAILPSSPFLLSLQTRRSNLPWSGTHSLFSFSFYTFLKHGFRSVSTLKIHPLHRHARPRSRVFKSQLTHQCHFILHRTRKNLPNNRSSHSRRKPQKRSLRVALSSLVRDPQTLPVQQTPNSTFPRTFDDLLACHYVVALSVIRV